MSGTATKEKLTVRHLLVVLTGIMITFGCSALCFSTWGLFQPVVAEGLGVEVTAFAMYVTVMYLTMTIASPFAGKLLQTMDIRILLSASAALVGCAFLLMSFSNTIVLFYVAAVMLGLGEITILWLAIPTLINRWFVERAGFFIGLCMAFTGIGGAIWSAVFTALTASGVDFHTIYLIWGVIALVTSLPFTLFCVRNSPEDCGLAPYGASMQKAASGAEVAAKPSGLSAGFVMKTPMFYAICVFAGLINIAILIAMQFPTYTKSLTDVAFDVAVVGGGDTALADALYLSNIASHVYLIHRRDAFRASPFLVERAESKGNIRFIMSTVVEEIYGEDRVKGLKLKNVSNGNIGMIDADGVFVAVGIKPNSAIAEGIVGLDGSGFIKAGEDCRTDRAGFFAAGDIRTKPLRQIICAVSDGAVAVESALEYLNRK